MSSYSKSSLQREVIISGITISYTHRTHKMSRSLRLVVYHDGCIVVTTPRRIAESSIVEFINKKFTWIQEKREHFKHNPLPEKKIHTPEEVVVYKKQAEKIVTERLTHFNSFYHFSYKKVTIKNVSTRWGSCSSKGNLNFNYKIALLPTELSDYIVVHELCHLKEMNHGEHFWNLVEKQIPNHKELRKQLRVSKLQ